MLARLLLGGVAWLVALGLFAALIQWSGSEPRRVTADLDGVDARSRAFNATRLASSHPERERWTVTRSAGFLTELVVSVVAERPDQARTIAEQIVLPVASKYQEVLVYVRALDEDDPLVRRVDWTPRGGFVVMAYNDQP